MKILLILVSLLNQGNNCPEGSPPSVRISVMKQIRHQNREGSWALSRTVTFRLVNESERPVLIYGYRIDGPFIPSGYVMFLDEKEGEWQYHPRHSKPPEKPKPESEFTAKRVLEPGEFISAFAFFSEADVGARFRWTAYAAFNANESPCNIRGEEFVLK